MAGAGSSGKQRAQSRPGRLADDLAAGTGDDDAALLDALGLGPEAVFGTSSGGNFALCLLIRHPQRVRGAVLHEPGLYDGLPMFAEIAHRLAERLGVEIATTPGRHDAYHEYPPSSPRPYGHSCARSAGQRDEVVVRPGG